MCVHYCVCALGWVEWRAQIPGMGHRTWPQITSLSLNSFMPGCLNHLTPEYFLNEVQFKAGFVKKLKLKDDHFHRRERWGEQCSLACKEMHRNESL